MAASQPSLVLAAVCPASDVTRDCVSPVEESIYVYAVLAAVLVECRASGTIGSCVDRIGRCWYYLRSRCACDWLDEETLDVVI